MDREECDGKDFQAAVLQGSCAGSLPNVGCGSTWSVLPFLTMHLLIGVLMVLTGPMKHKVCKMYMDKGAANEGTCRRDVQVLRSQSIDSNLVSQCASVMSSIYCFAFEGVLDPAFLTIFLVLQLQMIATKYAEAFNQHAPPKMVTFLSASYGRRCVLCIHVPSTDLSTISNVVH